MYEHFTLPLHRYVLTIKQKHLKRKEYHTSVEFAADVELVFSNALQFNEDHTPVWEAAQALRVRLMLTGSFIDTDPTSQLRNTFTN